MQTTCISTIIVKTVKELFQPSEIIEATVPLDTSIAEVIVDSRKAKKGSLFVALRGSQLDSHDFVPLVSSKNAVSVVDGSYSSPSSQTNYIKVHSTRELLGKIASRFWGNPTSQFNLVGITGTNGKTTTSFLLDQIWTQMGLTTGLVGTVHNKIAEEVIESELTTPGPVELQTLFHRMVQRKVEVCSMEVSSIALDQFRAQGAEFKVAVFTNFSQDHLDYHKTMDSYLKSKLRLFSDYKAPHAVVNADDKYSHSFLAASTAAHKLTYSLSNENSDFSVLRSQFSKSGTIAVLKTPIGELEINSPLIGAHNLMNVLAVLGVVKSLGQDLEKASDLLKNATGAPGRLQRAVSGEYYPNVFVDYAHSDDALENVLSALTKLRGDSNCKIITVFGCGGDRDKTKRPKMAKVASVYSDITIATSDNPRTEDPEEILDEVEKGVDRSVTIYHREPNRRDAIYMALKLASPEDIVLIAGKGHENYQIVGSQRFDFDDVQVVRDFYSL